MRLLWALALLVSACADTSDPDVRIERQSTTLADASTSAWTEGGAVLVAAPGTFQFPQPLSLRISIIDNKMLDADGAPTQLKITSATLAPYGTDASELTIKSQPTCQQNFCSGELQVEGQGESLLTIEAEGDGGKQQDCFYFAVYEDADPTTAGAMYQTELEKKQKDCRASFWN